MDYTPLPFTMDSEEKISDSFEIKQGKDIYKLDIKIINQDIILNLKYQKEFITEYENKFTFYELKMMHSVFSALNTCQKFLDYFKVIIENNKLSIKVNDENEIYIELNVEYPFKQNTNSFNLFKKKINFDLIAQDLYKKFSSLTENFKNLEMNYKNILQENKNIKEENNNIKNEIEKLKEENKNQKEKILNLEEDIFLCKELIFKNKENVEKENNGVRKNDGNNDDDFIILDPNDKNIQKTLDNIKILKKNLKTPDEKVKMDDKKIEIEDRTIEEILINQLIKIFSNQSRDIEIDDMNDLKKICSALIINKKEPLETINEVLINYFDNFQNGLDENNRENSAIKKIQIFNDIKEISLLKEVEPKDDEQFIKQFRDKFGITEKDFSDKNLKILINICNRELDILKIILKKLKYLK